LNIKPYNRISVFCKILSAGPGLPWKGDAGAGAFSLDRAKREAHVARVSHANDYQ